MDKSRLKIGRIGRFAVDADDAAELLPDLAAQSDSESEHPALRAQRSLWTADIDMARLSNGVGQQIHARLRRHAARWHIWFSIGVTVVVNGEATHAGAPDWFIVVLVHACSERFDYPGTRGA